MNKFQDEVRVLLRLSLPGLGLQITFPFSPEFGGNVEVGGTSRKAGIGENLFLRFWVSSFGRMSDYASDLTREE